MILIPFGIGAMFIKHKIKQYKVVSIYEVITNIIHLPVASPLLLANEVRELVKLDDRLNLCEAGVSEDKPLQYFSHYTHKCKVYWIGW